MIEFKDMVSIVIPAYNAEKYIAETIHSILSQTYSSWEIILVNDGSSDKTEKIVRSFSDKRISVISQKNAGVSSARNTGLEEAKGEFLCFFDADDLMTPEFLEVRTNVLFQQPDIGFAGGMVETFPAQGPPRKAVAENPNEEIHFFDISAVTIPSNYLFRTSVIKENDILFHTRLNSSADRFFLLQIARHAKGVALKDMKGSLKYRVSDTSMSHHVTPKLTQDYYSFYKELHTYQLLPPQKRGEIECRYLFSIASGFFLVRHPWTGTRLMMKAFFKHPLVFFKLVWRRLFIRKK